MSRKFEGKKPNKGHENGKREGEKPAGKPAKVSGAIAELDVFDYTSYRADAKAFNEARRKLVDYAIVHFERAAHVIEHGEEYDWDDEEPEKPEESKGDEIEKKISYARYENQWKLFDNRKAKYDENKVKLFGVIWGQCTTALRQKLTEMDDFEEFNLKKDPLKLWNRVKELTLEERAPAGIDPIRRIVDARNIFQRIYQGKNEKLADFYERFLTEVEAAEAAGVKFVYYDEIERPLERYHKSTKHQMLEASRNAARDAGSTEEEIKALKLTKEEEKVLSDKTVEKRNNLMSAYRDKHLAMQFINKLDRATYGAVNTQWHNDMIDGFDNYPTSVGDAMRKLNNRKMEARSGAVPYQGVSFKTEARQAKSDKGGKQTNDNANKQARGDDKKGTRACYFCGDETHMQKDCEEYKKCREAACSMKKGTSRVVTSKEVVEEVSKGVQEFGHEVGFITLEVQSALASWFSVMERYAIVLDNQSSVNIFGESSYLTNIRPAKKPCIVSGIGGEIVVRQVADFGKFGEVYYYEGVPNILCFHDVAKKYKVSYDQMQNVFVVETDKATIRFECQGKVYVYNPKKSREEVALVTTVEGNKLAFTKREVAKADEARELFIKLARPAMKDFINMVRQGRIENCPITVADIERAEVIYGKELGALRGRTTRQTPEHVVIKPRPVYADYQPVVCGVDLMFIDGLPFMVGVARQLGLITSVNLQSKEVSEMMSAIRHMQGMYKAHGRAITHLLCDGESGVLAVRTHIGGLGITLNVAAKGEHVPEPERAIRTIKERVRAYINTLPFQLTPMLKVHLVQYCVMMINMVPKGDSEQSPREELTGQKVDFKRDCKVQFGAYCQVHEDNVVTNTMEPRVTSAIALGPTGNAQGSYKFMSLSTWKIITRRSFDVIPMPQDVIRYLNERANSRNDGKISEKVAEKSKDDDESFEEGPQAPERGQKQGIPGESSRDPGTEEDSEELMGDAEHSDANTAVEEKEVNRDFDEIDDLYWHEESDDDSLWEEVTDRRGAKQKKSSSMIKQREKTHIAVKKTLVAWAIETWDALVLNTMSVAKSLRECGVEAEASIEAEFSQLLDKKVFQPVKYEELTPKQKVRILRTLMFLKRKRDGRLKARFCVDGRRQAGFDYALETTSPTVYTESVMMTSVIDAHEGRYVVVTDIEGAYLNADMPVEVLIEIDPVLTNILLKLKPEWKVFLTPKGTLVLKLLKALYGCIHSARLFYEHVAKTLNELNFKVNPYDMGVFNKVIDGSQCTITIHVDDLKISCKDRRGVESTLAALTEVYKKLSTKEGPVFEYLGVEFDHSKPLKVTISMKSLIEETLREFEVDGTSSTPVSAHLFVTGENRKKLGLKEKEKFHSIVAKLLYLAKHGRPDLLTAVSFLSTRVRDPDEDDWKKLEKLVKYLKGTMELMLTLEADDLDQMHVYIDASHAVHPDMKSHTGVVATFGKGAVFAKSSKQKLVAKSSTEAELIAIADGIDNVMWMRRFLREQGYGKKPVVIHQDNESTIKMVKNGRSTSKNTRHVNIRFFSIHEHVMKSKVAVVYTPTKDMLADYFTKPLMGALFLRQRDAIMNASIAIATGVPSQGCVERGALGGATSDHESTNEGRIDAGNDDERITKSLSGCAKSMEPVAEKYM